MSSLAPDLLIVEDAAPALAQHPFLALRDGDLPDFEGAAVLLADPQFLATCDLLACLARQLPDDEIIALMTPAV